MEDCRRARVFILQYQGLLKQDYRKLLKSIKYLIKASVAYHLEPHIHYRGEKSSVLLEIQDLTIMAVWMQEGA